MTREQRRSHALAAYHDGELSWFAHWRMERQLRLSPALRRELAELAELSDWVREIESVPASGETPDLWSEIGPALSKIDAEVGSKRTVRSQRPRVGWNWGPLAGAVALATLVFAVMTAYRTVDNVVDNGDAIPEYSLGGNVATAGGSLRYLQTNGVSYVVSQDSEDVTIIWLMDAADVEEGA